jgi:hypothetical protein
MATPNYTIVSNPSYGGILAGATTALVGIASEAAASKKAQQAYNVFADQLSASGLEADAAIYRGMASAETPNFLEAAITGKGATRNLEMPFAQALKLLNEERDRRTSLERTRMSSTAGGLSVTDRQGIRMEDSILTQDISIINQDVRDARSDMDKAQKEVEEAVASGAPKEVIERAQARFVDSQKRYQEGVRLLNETQGQRRSLRKQLTTGDSAVPSTDAGQAAAAKAAGLPDPGFLPANSDPATPTQESENLRLLPNDPSAEGNLVPFGVQDSGFKEDPVVVGSRSLRKKAEELAIKYRGNKDVISQINKAKDLSTLNQIDKEAKSNVSIFKSMGEALEYAKQAAGDDFVPSAAALRTGKGYVPLLLQKKHEVRRTSDREWSNGQGDIYFVGEDGVMYHRRANQPESEGNMITNKDGSGVTPPNFQTFLNGLGIAYGAGVTQNKPPLEVNPTKEQNARNPTLNKSPIVDPNIKQPKKTSAETMYDYYKAN